MKKKNQNMKLEKKKTAKSQLMLYAYIVFAGSLVIYLAVCWANSQPSFESLLPEEGPIFGAKQTAEDGSMFGGRPWKTAVGDQKFFNLPEMPAAAVAATGAAAQLVTLVLSALPKELLNLGAEIFWVIKYIALFIGLLAVIVTVLSAITELIAGFFSVIAGEDESASIEKWVVSTCKDIVTRLVKLWDIFKTVYNDNQAFFGPFRKILFLWFIFFYYLLHLFGLCSVVWPLLSNFGIIDRSWVDQLRVMCNWLIVKILRCKEVNW